MNTKSRYSVSEETKGSLEMNSEKANPFNRVKDVISGISMIVAPIATMIAFYIHPQFWTFKRESSAVIQFDYIQDTGWQVGHALVYLTIPLVLIMWVRLANLIGGRRPWLATAGWFLTVAGCIFMAGTFASAMAEGMIGLTFPKEQAIPVIQLMMDSPGWMQITKWGQLGILLGPMVLSIGLALSPKVAPRWAGVLAILGNLIIAVFIDIDAIMFWGELLILIGLWPVAMTLLKGKWSVSSLGTEPVYA